MATTTRAPKGYVGKNHETLGSDVLSIYEALEFPEMVLGEAHSKTLKSLDPKAWYPLAYMNDLVHEMHKLVGDAGLRKIGRKIFEQSHAKQSTHLHSVRQLVHGLDQMYKNANRGDRIGGWRVISFEPGEAILEKTTPQLCILEEGIVDAAMKMVGVTCFIDQTKCVRRGDDTCHFRLYSRIVDERWSG